MQNLQHEFLTRLVTPWHHCHWAQITVDFPVSGHVTFNQIIKKIIHEKYLNISKYFFRGNASVAVIYYILYKYTTSSFLKMHASTVRINVDQTCFFSLATFVREQK